jgi:flagellar assembly protein FliH
MEPDKKFLFDVNVFDSPPKEEINEDLPPPPPTFSEEDIATAKDIAFEKGRQQGQKEQVESREQFVAQTLATIAENFSKLFAAETVRESIFEKEALKIAIASLDVLFPSLNEKIGREEVLKVVEKTLSDHRKTKEISISIPTGMKGEVETLITRIRANEHDEVLWRVTEDPNLAQGDCDLEWSDGGAVRDSGRAARDIRRNLEGLLGHSVALLGDSEPTQSDVLSKGNTESAGDKS